MMRFSHLRAALSAATLLCIAAPTTAFAQDATAEEFVSLSQSQEQLNDEGVQAIIDGDYEGAIRSFKSSLALGEINVTYLNMGRALHKNGDCAEAQDAYAKALSTPKVALPTPDEVKGILDRYLSELDPAQCPAIVTFTCKPSATQVSIDGEVPTPCPDAPIKLAPGDHTIVAAYDEQVEERTLTLTGMASESVSFEFEVVMTSGGGGDNTGASGNDDNSGGSGQIDQPVDEGLGTLALVGIITAGVGGAALLTAVILESTVLADAVEKSDNGTLTQSDLDSAEAAQAANLGLYIGGGALVAAGVVLIFIPTGDDGEATSSFSPLVADGLGGLAWTTRW